MFLWLCSLLFVYLAIHHCYLTIFIFRYMRKSTIDTDLLYETNEGLLKRSISEVLWHIAIILIFILNVKVGIRNEIYNPEDKVFIYLWISVAFLSFLLYTAMRLMYPLIVAEKYSFIKYRLYKNTKIRYFIEDDTIVIIKQKRNGKQLELLCIHNNDTRTIIEVQKHVKQTEVKFDNEDNNEDNNKLFW